MQKLGGIVWDKKIMAMMGQISLTFDMVGKMNLRVEIMVGTSYSWFFPTMASSGQDLMAVSSN